jgi:hypothetical protein
VNALQLFGGSFLLADRDHSLRLAGCKPPAAGKTAAAPDLSQVSADIALGACHFDRGILSRL